MTNNSFENIADAQKALEKATNAGVETIIKKYKRVPTTTLMSPELKELFRIEYVREKISLADFLERLMIKQFKEDGFLS